MNRGAELLRAWIDRRKIKDCEAAFELGFTKGYLSKLLNGRLTPGRENAVEIQNHTGVAVAEWSAKSLSKADRRVSAGNLPRSSEARKGKVTNE